jgi:hypothetical protein
MFENITHKVINCCGSAKGKERGVTIYCCTLKIIDFWDVTP